MPKTNKNDIQLGIDYMNACQEHEANKYKMSRKEILYQKWKDIKPCKNHPLVSVVHRVDKENYERHYKKKNHL